MNHSLKNIEQESRGAILSCVDQAISKLVADAYSAGENSLYNEFALINTIRANVENDKHVHLFLRWEVTKTLRDQNGAIRVIQSRQCSECGFVQFKKTDIL